MPNRLVPITCFLVLISAVAGCDGKPEHYYVMCEDIDGNGWRLVDYQKDENGYLIACAYQSPDRKNAYIARCTDDGCD